MPIVRIGPKLVYFVHIPKCAGSSVEDYMSERFGPLAFLDRKYLSTEPDKRWSNTSPQHVNWATLERLFPAGFFSDIITVVRHPLDRAVSAYRFQSEVEGTVAQGTSFSEWLRSEADLWATSPHRHDNHSRPQVDFLPPIGGLNCVVFHLEHGLDALIPYFDGLSGTQSNPRAMGHALRANAPKVGVFKPDEADRALVAKIYAADFERFGYEPDNRMPLAPAPELSAHFLAENAAASVRAKRTLFQLVTRVRRRVRKWQR
ncbi:sulfotransferase family 2 domain-containing protein [Ruegeria atlantica]|uniref:Sulfotransferase family protein n=1 Tax=Ruegeria atlantica TaxID=81569 RepID=A0A0N7LQV5_9RHOB|nr:sulfotransferase family 2 domain-containing protein [Ruegeria atlantica]CUH49076.1 Sulfotransferase family protein [Ruegeria atlantica]